MHTITTFCWLGCFAFFAVDLFGQPPDEVLHDLVIRVEKDMGFPSLGMGGAGAYNPVQPDRDDSLVIEVVNHSERDLRINPKNVRVWADGGVGRWPLHLNGVPFLQVGDVTVPAGKSLGILRVRLVDVLDPATLKAQRTIGWNWSAHPSPPISPIVPNGEEYANVVVFWVEHVSHRRALRSRPLVIPVTKTQSR